MATCPRILAALKELKQKSCASQTDFNYLQLPNLEKERVATEVMNLLKDTSALLGAVTTVDRADCKGEIPRLDTCDIIAQGTCLTSCLPGASVEDSYVTYDMEKYVAAFTVDKDFLDCNKLGEPTQVNETMRAMILTQIRNNMELAAIYGDEDLPTGDGQTPWNNLMGKNDGWLKLACNCTPECQTIDAQGMGPSPALFMAARRSLPARYRANRGNYKFLVGPGITDWWAEYQSARPTIKGDEAQATGEGGRMWGNTFFEVPMWREDLTYGAQDVTHMLYTPMDNLMYLNRRQFDLMTEYKIETDKFQSVAYWTQDVAIQRPEEMVVIKNVDVCADPWVGCKETCYDCDYDVNNPACFGVVTTTTAAATTTTT
jgi:hypothetical protein